MPGDVRFLCQKPQELRYHVEQGRDWRPLTGRFSRLFNNLLRRLWHRFSQPHPVEMAKFHTVTVGFETIGKLVEEITRRDRTLRSMFDRGGATLICGPRQLGIVDDEMISIAKIHAQVPFGMWDDRDGAREKFLGIDILCLPWLDTAIVVPSGQIEERSTAVQQLVEAARRALPNVCSPSCGMELHNAIERVQKRR